MTSYILPDIEDNNLFEIVEDIFEKLLKCGITVCGFDTESTSDAYDRNELTNKYVSIIQICIQQDAEFTCYIIPVKKLMLTFKQFPKSMLKFLKSNKIIKVGADINGDKKKLLKFGDMKLEGFIDLQDLARSMGNNDYSLDSLARTYLNLKKLKPGSGDYDRILTAGQIKYAIYDAYLSLAIYLKMININTSPIENRASLPEISVLEDESVISIEDWPIKGIFLTENIVQDFYKYLKGRAGIFISDKDYRYSSILNIVLYGGYKPWNIHNNFIKEQLLNTSLKSLISLGHIKETSNSTYCDV